MAEELPDPTPDDRRKHLDYIQAVVTRMSAASSSAKSWLLPVVTATYGYALTKNVESLALLGMAAVFLFSILDANYLRQEKAYRRLYGIVASDAQVVPLFSLDASRTFFAALDNSAKVPDGDGASLAEKKIGRWRRVRKWIGQWLPEPQVWLSWSIAPFYGGLLGVGLVIYLSSK
ncbi:hypothetical protein [Plantactinospora sp. WMMB782]|uniref:hypothetical protein n=1 Tax=Plantactinospora sp. WMMB782 TaxID=3404121 RepID=UPI003B93B1FD